MSECGMRDPLYKHKRRRRRKRFIARCFFFLFTLSALVALLWFVFDTRELSITGLQYGSQQEVEEWLAEDTLARNSLYLFIRYHGEMEGLPAFVESVEVKLHSPWQVELQVREKPMLGFVQFGELYAHFDRHGIVSLILEQPIEGVPSFQDLEVTQSEIRLGQVLPVEDEYIFTQWAQISRLLTGLELLPDRVYIPNGWFELHFGVIEVRLGNRDFDDKISHLLPILSKLHTDFAGQAGILHMETFTTANQSIRFVPEGEVDLTAEDGTMDDVASDPYADHEAQDVEEQAGG